ncbi:hypothetical protein BASA61_002486 [Batrachochytrium salamandrivorans]|nr:hypothetical protein BASA61_002486 [Batrachochytrium salamandrivorans]
MDGLADAYKIFLWPTAILPWDPENSSALKAELSIHRSEHRSKVAKFVILGLLFIQVVLSAWIFYDCLQTSATFSRAVVNYPGQALLIVTWLIALVMYSLAAGVDSYIPTSTASSHPLGAPVYTGLLWLAFTRLVSVPIDIRLVWIVCEAHPTTVSYCSSKDITATIAGFAITLIVYASLKTLRNEHRLRVWLTTNDKSPKETNASIWSRITFSWMDDVISLGFDRPLDLDDLNHLIPQDRSDFIITAYEGCCNANRSLIGNLAVFFAPSLAIQAVFSLVTAFATLASPYFLRKIIIFTENPASVSHPSVAVFYALAIFTFTFIRSVCDGQMYFIGRRIGLRIRSIVIMLVYDKSLRPASHPDLHIDGSTQELGASSGKIVNLMSSDAFKILEVASYFMYLWMTPLEVILCILFLVIIAGAPGLAGVAVMVVMIPLGGVIGRLVSRLQKRLMESTDMRINAINELLQGIRVIKFFAWEPRFFSKIEQLRENELSALWSYVVTAASSRVIWTATPVLVSFLTFVSMTWLAGRDLDASTAFTALSLFNVLRMPLQTFPDIIVKLMEALVSVRRIENYLKEPEIASSVDVRVGLSETVQFTGDASFSWYSTQAAATRPVSHLKKLTLQFPKGALSVVYGPTGCGKSSLLMAILGEMHLNSGGGGGVHLGPLQRGTTHLPIAFASQQVWLQNATIRENICFGTPFDSDRYQATLIACSLVKDLDNMDGGDLTEVGEKGVNLSGGQKARISLARAVYSTSPVVLLDDPLSAVDAPTARHIFDKCICGPLLAGRTRILVTHAKALCAPKADFVVRLSMGSVRNAAMSPSRNPPLSEGPELSTTEPIFPVKQIDTMPPPSNHQQKQHADVLPSVTVEDAVSSSTVKRITIEEARSSGSVPFRTYWVYLSSAGGPVFVLFVVLTYILAQGLMISTDLWLKTWVSAYHTPNYATDLSSFSSLKGTLIQSSGTQWIVDDASLLITKSLFYSMDLNHTRVAETSPRTIITQWLGTSQSLVDLPFYIGIYALLGTLAIIAVLFRVWIIARGSLHASRALHNRLVMKLLRAPVQFFEKTPVGRILNRVSKDMKDIDQEVAFFTGDFFGNCISATGILCLILYATPRAIFSVFPVLLVYLVIGKQYIRSSRELKRLDSTTRSPIFSHFGETISGASTIRAYAAQDRFVKETHRRIDENNLAFFNLWVSNRWLGIRVDFSGSLITLASALASVLAVLFDYGINPGLAGLSISYALLFTDSLLWVIRMHALMEMEINAVERVGEYLQIEEEAPATIPGTCLDPLWPKNGHIRVENLSLRYSPESDPVLSNVTFECHAGEKVAVVGRTGAGKTTLSLAFFRFLEFDTGSITIDGVDISSMGLHDLRSCLTVIPQDPVLFSGTLRSNLDPFSEHTDAEIWSCLNHSHFIESLRQESLSTSSSVSSLAKRGSQGHLVLPRESGIHQTASSSVESFRNHESTAQSISIDSPVCEGGTNFSQGQRQLLCLARALLRRSRVVLLDEATASVDHDTDLRIQLTIRNEFRKATLLCIAHRLRTIIDYDKVLVLDKGRVAQFASPHELLSDHDGIFYAMCAETGELDELKAAAAKHG